MAISTMMVVLLSLQATAADAGEPGRKRRTAPSEFGRVVIQNHSRTGVPPVVFDHWRHRAKYTCRLCHVDIGFAMKAGASDIRAADNEQGAFCGACHNGKPEPAAKLFEACSSGAPLSQRPACYRCHSFGKNVKPAVEFAEFAKRLPRGRFGNGVDWEKAEIEKVITPVDYLEGVSIRRTPLTAQRDFALDASLDGMPDIVFSHVKHTVWNGCELCHPQIFVGVKRGATKYSMVGIFEGKACGACHVTVAFPLQDCQRCHSKRGVEAIATGSR